MRNLDKPITADEIQNALDKLNKDKTPGSDGLPQEFLSFFWDDLKDLYQKVLDEIFTDEELTVSQQKGIIKISYKKNGRQFLKNYRPITLLNTDLKIIAKVLAIRLSKILNNIIHETQKCVPGRKITENIHLMQDLIDSILQDNSEAAIIFLDQEKAFDRISHKFLFKTLQKFGFGDNFIRWIKIIYKNVTSTVKVNGFLTDKINIKRGLRQGCPLSALLYVLCSEVLSINIRKNENIKGIIYESQEHKDSMYADDMSVVVTTENSIYCLFELLNKYEAATNSKINKDKTKALWLGSWRERIDKPLNLKWTNQEVENLIFYIGNDRKNASQKTFNMIKDCIKGKISYWNNKSISLKGKVKLLNIFVLSKLWNALECHDIPKDDIVDINGFIKSFVWRGYNQRQLGVLSYPYSKGGLALQSIECKMETFRLKWIENLMTCSHLSFE